MQSTGTLGKVPKFTSFRPKPAVPQDSSVKEDRSQTPREHRHHDPDNHKKQHRLRNEEVKKRNLELDTPKGALVSETLRTEAFQDQVFVSDKHGDLDNIRYGSIHRYAIPRYSRAGLGSVVGLHRNTKIDRSSSTEKGLVLFNNTLQVTRNKHIFAKVRSQEEVRVRPNLTSSLDELKKDYVLLGNSRNSHSGKDSEGRRSPGDTSNSTSDDEHYRSIEGRAKSSKKPDDQILPSETENDKQNDSHNGHISSKLMATRSMLSKKVEQEPKDSEAWFSLIQHEDILHNQSRVGRRSTWPEMQSDAEIKVSLYEKALKAVVDPGAIEALFQGLLREGQLVWDDSHLRKKWEDALSKHGRSRRLWIQYLGFLQTTSNNYKFDDIKDAYDRCFQILRPPGFLDSNVPDAETYSYLLLRFTLFLRGAGFPEQAFAVWQANLEWNIGKPPGLTEQSIESSNIDELAKRSFEDFWDAEVPRIGEEGSPGWAAYSLQPGEVQASETYSYSVLGTSAPMLEKWGVVEGQDAAQSFLPARTTDKSSEDDPYRVVLFSDIEPYLLDISGSDFRLLIDSFLLFCGLPAISNEGNGNSDLDEVFIRDGTMGSTNLGNVFDQHISSDNASVIGDDQGAKQRPFGMNTRKFCLSLDTLFAQSQSWFSAFESSVIKEKNSLYSTLHEMIRKALKAIIDSNVAGIEVLEYYVAFESHFYGESARKVSRALIKKQPSSLRLYNVYALVEYRLRKPEKAQDALKKAIQMSSGNLDIALLRRTLIWETMDLEGAEAALLQLFATSGVDQENQGPNNIDASTILAIQKELLSSRDRAMSSKSYSQALANIDLLILLSYLTNPHSLQVALAIFSTNIALLSSLLPAASPTHQLLHQSLARLLYFHATHSSSFQPSVLRSTLRSSISLFPTNTIFLSLYAWNEARFRINDRVRSVVRDILDSPTSTRTNGAPAGSPQSQLIPHLFAIHTELIRPQALGSNANTIRSTFERALSTSYYSDGVAHSPLIWFEYFHFEVRAGDLKRARDVFYRAIGKVPWVKDLYLLPWRYLRDVMGKDELRGIYELVQERELRVRVQASDV
ncbi:Protein nrde2 [Thelotrema lepadinum]|nr:Protein nrde2 [Thelotrema lepadinum]